MFSEDQKKKLEILEIARQLVEKGEAVPSDYCRILFPPEKREYELTYFGKESVEQVLSSIMSVPLQENKIFPPYANIKEGAWINKLIFGENLQILKTLIGMKKNNMLQNNDGTNGIRLIYIDPPFATKQEFKAYGSDQVAYADKLLGAKFIEFIRKRLILAKELLADNGSIFVHLDWKTSHYIKIILDEVFGRSNFRDEIIWHYKRWTAQSDSLQKQHDTILHYSKSNDYVFNKLKVKTVNSSKKYSSNTVNGGKVRQRLVYDRLAYEEAIKNGKLRNEQQWDNIVYVNDDSTYMDDVWNISIINSQALERTGYPTQKPEKLIERIIKLSTNEGDLVMDFFAGSGTTPAVSEKLNRRWIAVDVGKYAIYTMQKRLLNIDKVRPFILYSGGLYDAEKLNKFDNENWKLFALQLWGCQPDKKTIKGLVFDGIKENNLVKVYSPQELQKNGSKISIETIHEIDNIVGKSIGSEIFIIAPQGQFTFAEDDVEINSRIYHTLRVPYSLLAKFTEDFTPPTQPKDTDSVNDIVDAVGFDFIQPPFVDFEIKGNYLIVKKFKSNSRLQGEQKTELSMILIDYNYNGLVFELDDILYNKDIYQKGKDVKLKERILIKDIHNKAMFIFIDNSGNEKKVVINDKE